MSRRIKQVQLTETFRLRDEQLERIERQYHRLDEKLSALEAMLPEVDQELPEHGERPRKPR